MILIVMCFLAFAVSGVLIISYLCEHNSTGFIISWTVAAANAVVIYILSNLEQAAMEVIDERNIDSKFDEFCRMFFGV